MKASLPVILVGLAICGCLRPTTPERETAPLPAEVAESMDFAWAFLDLARVCALGEDPVSSLDVPGNVGDAAGCAFSSVGDGLTCWIDADGTWHSTPIHDKFRYEGAMAVSCESKALLCITVEVTLDGVKHEAAWTATRIKGQALILLKSPEGNPRLAVAFWLYHRPKEKAEPEASTKAEE